jgi:hypothetical protein
MPSKNPIFAKTAAKLYNAFMARPKKIQQLEPDDESENVQKTLDQILIMPIAELLKLTPEQQQLFRVNGGTSTEN